jgi:hypothetical protein
MPTTPRSQSALATDQNFLKRLSSLLLSEAVVIGAEPPPDPLTQTYDKRTMLAHQVISNPAFVTQSLAHTVCNATNLVAAETTYNFEALAVETSASDAEIRSQIATLWDVMAGV